MTVYVDKMRAPLGRMFMCHMFADSDEDLHEMASRIGVARRYHQHSGTARSHYDICLTKRDLAVRYGAVEIGRRRVGEIIRQKRAGRPGAGGQAWKRS